MSDYAAVASELAEGLDVFGTGADGIQPIDWATFWLNDAPEVEWAMEPIVPGGRQVAVYGAAKDGKSLLALDGAAAEASGGSVFGYEPEPAIDVIYCDLEMTEDDLRGRLVDMGYGPESDLSHLHYYQLPNLPPLDTDAGGKAMAELVDRHQAALVVVARWLGLWREQRTSRTRTGTSTDSPAAG